MTCNSQVELDDQKSTTEKEKKTIAFKEEISNVQLVSLESPDA